MPPDVAGHYEKLSPKAKEETFKGLSGSTFGNSHRDAFVKGTVMGMDTFKLTTDKLEEQVQAGKMTRKDFESEKANLQKLKGLSPAARDAYVEMILLQQGK